MEPNTGTTARGVDDRTEGLLRIWTQATHTLISTGHAQFLYQTLETAYASRDLASEDWLLLNYLRDPTVTLSPAILSSPSTSDAQSPLSLERHSEPASQAFGDGAPTPGEWIFDVPWGTEFSDGYSLGAPWPTSPGSMNDGADGDGEHMVAIPAPTESSLDSPYELPHASFNLSQGGKSVSDRSGSSSYTAKELLPAEDTLHVLASSDEGSIVKTVDSTPLPPSPPQPMSTNLHEQSLPNSNYIATYTSHIAEFLSDTGRLRPTAARRPAQQMARNTNTWRRKQKRKQTQINSHTDLTTVD